MYVLPGFNPAAPANQEIDISNAEVDGKILIYNESPYALKLDFYNGDTDIIHANEANYWILDGETPSIGWSVYSTVDYGSSAPAISEVTLTLYPARQKIPGTYPISLTRQVSFGSAVPLMTSVTSVVNDISAPGTVIVEGTPVTSHPIINFGTTPTRIENGGVIKLGNDQISGSITFGGGISAPTTTNALDGINGLTIQNGKVSLEHGGLTANSHFSGTGTATVSHGLVDSSGAGLLPDFVEVMYHGPFGSQPTQLLSYDSEGATTVHIVAQSGYNWQAVAYKF